jgi:hypothetical protein
MLQKEINKIGTSTYLLAIVIFNLFNSFIFLYLPEFKDWELFSFNLYGSFVFYFVSLIILLIISLLFKKNNLNKFILLFILIVLPEVPAYLLVDEFIIKSIIKTIVEKSENYILLFYPISIIISYFLCVKAFGRSKK